MNPSNQNTRKALRIVACLIAFTVGVIQVQGARSEYQLNKLLVGAGEERHSDDMTKDPARKQRAWRLYSLWMARDKQNVAPRIAPYLNDESVQIRVSAARMLGRLERPESQVPLQQVQAQTGEGQIDPTVLKLAIGRIRARNLKGESKFAALAKSVNLSPREATRLTAKYVAAWSKANKSPSETITREFVELLYDMGKQKQNITPIVQRLTLYPAQQLQLKASLLSSRKEVELILNYLAQLDVVTQRDSELSEHLVRLGPVAKRMLIARLTKDAQQNRSLSHSGYSELFTAAALLDDPQIPNLLQKFHSNSNSYLAGYSNQARMMAQHRIDTASPLSPYPPLP